MIQTIGQLNRKNRNRLHLYNYLKDKSCVDCGETDPVVLDFDHIKDKKYNISYLIALGYSISKIDEEINKCEIRCANCHRRKTSKQLGWYDKNNPTISNRYNILKSLRKTMILGIRGSQVKSSKLKEEEVIDIKNLLKSGKTATEIAVIYGLSLKSICNIKNNKTWKHVIV